MKMNWQKRFKNTVRESLVVLDGDLRVISASQSFCDTFKVNPKQTIGQAYL
ncbi:MAG: hypothetical protein ABIH08_02400 [Candidatus Omnitrophota bacterium]